MTRTIQKTLFLLGLATGAMAPALAQADPFNGAYAGVEAGWEDTRGSIGSGLSYGALLGYNAKVGEQFVVGLEGKIGLSTADYELTRTIAGGTIAEDGKAGRSLGIAGRAGFLASPSTLFYGKVGYENVRTKIEQVNTPTGGTPTTTNLGFNTDAVVLGLGVEHAFTDRVSLRVGYDYTDGKAGFRRNAVKTGLVFNF
jgi:outer membrane immunogenic protein